MLKTRVNLYSTALLPVKLALSFARLSSVLMLMLLCVLLLGGLLYWNLSQVQQELRIASREQVGLLEQKQILEAQVASHLPDAALVAQVEAKVLQIEFKHLMLSGLGDNQGSMNRGFASLLTELASVADDSSWLSRIRVEDDGFQFEGYARHPQSVPQWIARLKTTSSLRGHGFAAMTMARDEGKPLAFTLTSIKQQEPGQ
jgi:Tfp pilus assembly protein PilN